jgi:hypothetical protein
MILDRRNLAVPVAVRCMPHLLPLPEPKDGVVVVAIFLQPQIYDAGAHANGCNPLTPWPAKGKIGRKAT